MNKEFNHDGTTLNECLGLSDKEILQSFSKITEVIFKDHEHSFSRGIEALEELIEDPVYKRVALLHLASFMALMVDQGLDAVDQKMAEELNEES